MKERTIGVVKADGSVVPAIVVEDWSEHKQLLVDFGDIRGNIRIQRMQYAIKELKPILRAEVHSKADPLR